MSTISAPHNPNAPINPFGAPIPGQHWTTPRKSQPWQKPPQFVDARKAAEWIWQHLTQPKTAVKILAALKMGVPAEAAAKTFLFHGVTKGMWTSHLSVMLVRPVMHMIVKIAHLKKVKHKVLLPDLAHKKTMGGFADAMQLQKNQGSSGGASTDQDTAGGKSDNTEETPAAKTKHFSGLGQ